MLIITLLLFLIILRLVIGVRLAALARRNNLPNIYWLAGVFFVSAVSLFFAPAVGNPLGGLPVSLWLGVGAIYPISIPSILAFNHTTFYQGKKSPLGWYVGFCAIFILIGLYGVILSESNYDQHPWVAFFIIGNILAWVWHAQVAYRALAGLAQEQHVEDWVKARYGLIILYSVVLIIALMSSFVRTFFAGGSNLTPLGSAMGFLYLITQIIGVTLQFLVWVMPEWFRRWLNRNQQVHAEERLQEQALAILNILGAAMSEGTGLSSMSALIVLRKTIGQVIGTEDSASIAKYASAMGYREWQSLLNSRDFQLWVESLGVQGNPRQAIENATRALTEKQSLFTMQAK